ERVVQAPVATSDPVRGRASSEALQHAVRRALDGMAADQWTDGDGGPATALDGVADLAHRQDRQDADEGIARGDHDQVGAGQGPEHSRGGPGQVLAFEADAGDIVPVAPGDEPLLQRERAYRRVDPGPQLVVGRRQDRRDKPERSGEPRGDGRQWLAAPQGLGTDEMQPDVAVAEPEPGLAAQPRRLLERVPGLVRAAPPALVVCDP